MCQKEAEHISGITVSLYWQFIVDNKNAENTQVWNQQLGKEYNVDEKIEKNDDKCLYTSSYFHITENQEILKKQGLTSVE